MPLFYWLGFELKTQAIPLALFLNFVTVLSAAVTYWRKKLISIKPVLPFVIAISIFPFVGAYLAGIFSEKLILLFFAVILIIVAVHILIERRSRFIIKSQKSKVIVGIMAGAVVGVIVGMLGRGAGSFVVPILLLMSFDPKMAVGTASFINCLSSFTGFLGNISLTMFDWYLFPFVAASIIGSQLGSRLMAKKLREEIVKKIFAAVIGAIGIWMIINLMIRG